MIFILNFCHCFDCMRIHRMAFKIGFCQQAHLGKYLGIAKSPVVSLTPRTPCRVAVKIISSYITKKTYDLVCIIITFYTLAAKLVKRLSCTFFFFDLRHSKELVDSNGKHLGNGRNQFKIGIGCSVFPAADRLICYTQTVSKRLLCQIVFFFENCGCFHRL